jgi:tetratricopeptide (TPR) repeat protein
MHLPVSDDIQKSAMYLRALNRQIEKEPDNAFAYRLIGEHYEIVEDYKMALKHFEQAYAIDSKIGVKNKIKKYRKQLGENSPGQSGDK